MTCKIERLVRSKNTVVLRVCGRIQVEHLNTIKELIEEESRSVVFDLEEVMLVEREAVKLLALCELNGIKLKNCPAFLREWLSEEQLRLAAELSNRD